MLDVIGTWVAYVEVHEGAHNMEEHPYEVADDGNVEVVDTWNQVVEVHRSHQVA